LPEENSQSFKIEFRPLELQSNLTDNVQINCYMILLTRAFLIFKPDILIPISQLDKNMNIAHEINSINSLFYFKEININNIISFFISENNLTEKDFEDLCCIEEKYDITEGVIKDDKNKRKRRRSAEMMSTGDTFSDSSSDLEHNK